MLKLSKYERNVCQFFVVCGTMFHKKNNRVIKQRNVYNNTKGFLIRTHPHHVCHSHHKVFSSAPMRTVARVGKHWPKIKFHTGKE